MVPSAAKVQQGLRLHSRALIAVFLLCMVLVALCRPSITRACVAPALTKTALGGSLLTSSKLASFLSTMGADSSAQDVKAKELADDMQRAFTTTNLQTQVDVFQRRFSENAVFEDPLMRVKGRRNVELEFYSLIKLFDNITYTPTSVTVTPCPAAKGPDLLQVNIENDQVYLLSRSSWLSKKVMPEKVELQVSTKLDVDPQTWQVVRHQEVWNNKSVPVPRFLKGLNGWSSLTAFKIAGWGKDVDKAAKGGIPDIAKQ